LEEYPQNIQGICEKYLRNILVIFQNVLGNL
jgi:hypothetical protein